MVCQQIPKLFAVKEAAETALRTNSRIPKCFKKKKENLLQELCNLISKKLINIIPLDNIFVWFGFLEHSLTNKMV